MPGVESTFAALADPARLRMLESLARRPATATRLAGELPISRQAVAKHLTRLEDAALVGRERVGREAIYTVRSEPLREVAAWSERVGAEWDARLDRLERLVA